MANSTSSSSSNSFSFFFIFLLLSTYNLFANGCFTSIISFGDSLADTGNVKQLVISQGKLLHILLPPYGETFFHKPTGRSCNGRLIIDFLAENLGLPLIPPYVSHADRNNVISNLSQLRQGVNFAVAGSTALDTSFLEERGIYNPSNVSLGTQLGWFKQFLRSICRTPSACRDEIGRSLVLMGEIGGNDYNFALLHGKSLEDIKSYVPLVTKTIASGIKDLIEAGAKTLVVPGNIPIGCLSSYLTAYSGSGREAYDMTTGCLVRLNKFAEYHNEMLQRQLQHIQELHPDVKIIYADYYNAAMQIFRSPNDLGFTNEILKACCGGGGPFNYNSSAACATPSSTACRKPNMYANWDGLHLTEAAYRVIYRSLFEGSYTTPRFNFVCNLASTSQASGGLSSSA